MRVGERAWLSKNAAIGAFSCLLPPLSSISLASVDLRSSHFLPLTDVYGLRSCCLHQRKHHFEYVTIVDLVIVLLFRSEVDLLLPIGQQYRKVLSKYHDNRLCYQLAPTSPSKLQTICQILTHSNPRIVLWNGHGHPGLDPNGSKGLIDCCVCWVLDAVKALDQVPNGPTFFSGSYGHLCPPGLGVV